MPRPKNKTELLELAAANMEKVLVYVGGLPPDARKLGAPTKPTEDQTVADVLCHLHEWHLMMETWYKVGMAGKKPAIPAADITWQKLPTLNQRIREKYRGTALPRAKSLLKKSHARLINIIGQHSDAELFTKKKYPWTGSTSLGAYLISATSSHYDWALKKLKRYRKVKPTL